MTTPKIKICGIHTQDALEAAISARADYVGFNFYPPSPRYVDARGAAELGERADGRIARIGVFVDEKDAEISEVVEAARLNAIQLHGDETPERAAQLRSRFGLPVWKVIAVASESDLARADAYRDAADFILFDAKTPKGTLPGGMGLKLNYSNPIYIDDVAADFPDMPIILAHPSFPWQEEALSVATHKPNVYIDLSGWSPKYFPPILVRYCNTLLRHKMLFGSDWPAITPDRWLADFEKIDIREDVRPLILKENTRKLLGI